MKRIATENREVDKFGAGKDGFRAAVPGVSDPTYLSAEFCNGVQEALVRTIERAGLEPSDDPDQFADALFVKEDLAVPTAAGEIGHRSGTVASALDSFGNYKTDRFFSYARASLGGTWFQPILLIGDSISEGSHATDFKSDSFGGIIRKAFQAKYKTRNTGFANFSLANAELYPSDTKYVHKFTRVGFNSGPQHGFSDDYYGGTVLKTVLSGDYVDVVYTGKDAMLVVGYDPAGGRVEVSVDGVVVGIVNTALEVSTVAGFGPNGSFSAPIPVPKWGQHTMHLRTMDNKPVALCGVFYIEDYTVVSPVFSNLGRSSIAMSDISDDLLERYAAGTGASILALGVNDDLLGKDPAVFAAKVNTYLENVNSVQGACVVCDLIFSKPPTNAYKTVLREAAAAHGFPYLDFAKAWFGNTNQNQFAGLLHWDGVHATDAGHEFMAAAIMRVIGLNYDKSTAIGYEPPVPPVTASTVGITTSAPWVGLAAGYGEAGQPALTARREVSGRVFLAGVVSGGTVAAYNLIATVPPGGYRPRKIEMFAVSANHAFGEIEIHPDGGIRSGGTPITGPFSLSGISYRGEDI